MRSQRISKPLPDTNLQTWRTKEDLQRPTYPVCSPEELAPRLHSVKYLLANSVYLCKYTLSVAIGRLNFTRTIHPISFFQTLNFRWPLYTFIRVKNEFVKTLARAISFESFAFLSCHKRNYLRFTLSFLL